MDTVTADPTSNCIPKRFIMKNPNFFYKLCMLILLILSISCKKAANSNSFEVIPSHPLNSVSDLDLLLEEIGNDRLVLLGEASHGTAEFYEWRTEISRRLIEEKGFKIIAVEGEWADSYRMNQFITGGPKDSTAAVSALQTYNRWPTWMWGNRQVASLITWLNSHNQGKAEIDKARFYGLDVYCLWEAMQEITPLLPASDPLLPVVQQVNQCFQPFSANPEEYADAVSRSSVECRSNTEALWQQILQRSSGSTAVTEPEFVIQQNALVALNGEKYYRTMITSGSESWNIRDRHMMQTIKRLLDFHGADSKMIIWAHNTHVGDARFTDMADAGMVNIGQLTREELGEENVFLVGFGTYQGRVIAGKSWGSPLQEMKLPEAKKGSWEHLLHQNGTGNKLLLSSELIRNARFMKSIGHRAVGVVYNPNNEQGNYVPTIIPKRYDAFVFIDNTTALEPLQINPNNEPPDTYPTGY